MFTDVYVDIATGNHYVIDRGDVIPGSQPRVTFSGVVSSTGAGWSVTRT